MVANDTDQRGGGRRVKERDGRGRKGTSAATRVSRAEAGKGGGHRGGMLLEHSFHSCSVNFSLCAN